MKWEGVNAENEASRSPRRSKHVFAAPGNDVIISENRHSRVSSGASRWSVLPMAFASLVLLQLR